MANMAKKTKKLRHVKITPAANGYNVETQHEPDEDDAVGGRMQSLGYRSPTTQNHVFPHHEHAAMLQHVAEQAPPPDGVEQSEGPMPGEDYAGMMSRRAAAGRKKKA